MDERTEELSKWPFLCVLMKLVYNQMADCPPFLDQMIVKPRSDCNKHTIKREHYTRKDGEWKPKQKFDSCEEAAAFIKKHKMYKYTPYVCSICGAWHIGMKKDVQSSALNFDK